MSGLLLPGDLRKRLAELQAEQAAQRSAAEYFKQWEVRALVALQQLAHRLFQDRGVIEFRPGQQGVAYLGRAHVRQKKGRPEAHRYREADWLFCGSTMDEIQLQVDMWKAFNA